MAIFKGVLRAHHFRDEESPLFRRRLTVHSKWTEQLILSVIEHSARGMEGR